MEPFQRMGYGRYFPATDYYASHFNSCALVSSAGSMLGSKLGPEIGGYWRLHSSGSTAPLPP